MTVKEYIAKLQEFDPNLDCIVYVEKEMVDAIGPGLRSIGEEGAKRDIVVLW